MKSTKRESIIHTFFEYIKTNESKILNGTKALYIEKQYDLKPNTSTAICNTHNTKYISKSLITFLNRLVDLL